MLALAALAIAGTLGPFALFAYGQSRVAPELAGAFLNLEPLVGTAAGALAFGDPFGPPSCCGGAVILRGIALSTTPRGSAGGVAVPRRGIPHSETQVSPLTASARGGSLRSCPQASIQIHFANAAQANRVRKGR